MFDEIIARKEAVEKENALLRRGMREMGAEMGAELDEYRRAYLEEVRKNEHLQSELARATGEIRALRETIRQMKDEDGGGRKLLKRYENPNTPGDTSWNDKRRKLRREEEQHDAAQEGRDVKEPKMGPPPGHRGHGQTYGGGGDNAPVIIHHDDTPQCQICGMVNSTIPLSKIILDFDGYARFMSYVRHTGYATICGCGQTILPPFPGIPGTFFGNEALRHILVYATRRSTDSDISYYFKSLNGIRMQDGARVSPSSILNARRSISMVLEPSMQYILDELKKARFIQLDETPFKYRKRKAYVWVIRTDKVCMILALSGRGIDDILPFVKDLRDKPITVDGYSVYLSLFGTLQRCWAHILRDAEDVCISNDKVPYYRDLYRSLKSIFHRAKDMAAATAAAGGADMATCRKMADEVRIVAAGYGRLDFANKLASAADNLFTFMRYPGMPPTNNGSERDIRDWVVPIREVSHKFMTERGMRVFSILQSFAATCSKLHLDVGDAFLKVLDDPTYNMVREGLKGDPADLPMLPAPGAIPMLPAPRPSPLPTIPAGTHAAPPPLSPGMITRVKPPALLTLRVLLAVLLESGIFRIPPSSGRRGRTVNHHVLPVHESLWISRVGFPIKMGS